MYHPVQAGVKVMQLFMLEPEVPGGWGPGTTVINWAEIQAGLSEIPSLAKCEIVFEDWLGDDLVTSHPFFVVTERLASAIQGEALTGAVFRDAQVSVSDQFADLNAAQRLPQFKWLVPEGRVHLDAFGRVSSWTGHDICLSPRADLVVSEQCLKVFRRHAVSHCRVRPLNYTGSS